MKCCDGLCKEKRKTAYKKLKYNTNNAKNNKNNANNLKILETKIIQKGPFRKQILDKESNNIKGKIRKVVGEKTLKDIFKNDEERIKYIAWIKTFLCAYHTLPNIISLVDSIVESRALNGYNVKHDIVSEMERIIDMSERKIKLLALKDRISKMLECLSKEDKKFVLKRFANNNASVKQLAFSYDISPRNYYRKINRIIYFICENLKACGQKLEDFEVQTKGEPWIQYYFEDMLEKQVKDEKRKNTAKCKIEYEEETI